MKKYLLLFLATALGFASFASAYEQQGFNQYNENADGTINFWCQQSCAILLGDKADNDSVVVKGGTHQGDGMRGYGYVVGQNVYAATVVPANSYEWSFADDPIYKQLPAGSNQVLFLVSGPLKADGVKIGMRSRSGGEALGWTWKRFWNVEHAAPYSINLHYGPMVGGWSWPLFGAVIMLISIVVIYVVRKKMTFNDIVQSACVTLIFIMIIGGARLLYDHIAIVRSNQQKFSQQSLDNKKVFDLGDYISVTEKVRNQLDLDNIEAWRDKECTVYAKTNADRPFYAHWSSVYLRPCTLVKTGSMAEYHLYYNVLPETKKGNVILSGNSFTLYDLRP